MTPPISGPSEGLNAAVAAVLRAERAAQEMTIDALAVAADVPEISVRRYLKAQRHIDVATLHALADALGLTAGEVVTMAQERQSKDGDVAAPRAARNPGRKPSLADDEDAGE